MKPLCVLRQSKKKKIESHSLASLELSNRFTAANLRVFFAFPYTSECDDEERVVREPHHRVQWELGSH
jgi:hypothetical protein